MSADHMVEFIEGAPVWHPYPIQERGHATPCFLCGKPIESTWKRYVVPRGGHAHVYCQYIPEPSESSESS